MKVIKRAIIAISIVVILVISVVSLLLLTTNKDKQNNNNIALENIKTQNYTANIVKNRNIFFTVSSCVSKYLGYIPKKDTQSLYTILDKEYINKNLITVDNVLKHVDNISSKQIFVADKMYEVVEDDYNSTFYVSGTIREDNEEQRTQKKQFYITVKLNYEECTFSIIPFEYIPKNVIIKNN